MKKQFLFATLALATMFTACSKEEELSKNEGGTPVNFVIGGIGARTVTDASTYAVNFVAGESIGLFGSGFKDGASFVNKEYSVNSDLSGLTAPDSEPTYYMGDSNPTIYAYRPYNSSNTSTTVEHIVCTDQSITQENDVTIDGFNGSDFMVATTSINGSTISLTFEHKMAMVELNFGENLSALGVTQVSMNTLRGIKYDLTTNTTTPLDGTFIVNMYNVANNKFWAIVPPQTVTGDGNTVLFTITAGGRTFYYTPANAVEEKFTANKVRKITLDIAGTGDDEPIAAVFKLASVTVNDWGTEEDENTTTVVEKKLDVSIDIPETFTITDGETTTTNLVVGQTSLTDEKPFGYMTGSDLTAPVVTVIKEEVDETQTNVLSFMFGTGTSWYNNTLICYAGANAKVIEGQTYKISFDVKASEGATALWAIALQTVKNGNSSHAYTIGADNSTAYEMNNVSTSAYTRYSFMINSTYSTNITTTKNQTTTTYESAKNDIVVAFCTKSNLTNPSGTYYIKNIKIEQQ